MSKTGVICTVNSTLLNEIEIDCLINNLSGETNYNQSLILNTEIPEDFIQI